MRSSNIRSIIQIRRPDKEKQSSGQDKEINSTLVKECWASVICKAGSEVEIFDQMKATYSYDIEIHFTSTVIKETDFIIHKGQRIEIESVIPDPFNRSIKITGTR